jgi:hypothetical protein
MHRRLVDLFGLHLSGNAATRKFPGRSRDVGPAAIGHRHGQGHARIARGQVHGAMHALAQRSRQLVQIADEQQANAVAVQFVHFVVQGFQETVHEHGNFVARAFPVFAREREQGQHFDAAPRAVLDGLLHGLHAHAMARRARQGALGGPATVAVHDHGDVARHLA